MIITHNIKQQIKSPIFPVILLFTSVVIANIVANTSLADHYFAFLNTKLKISFGNFNLLTHMGHDISVLEFINDGLMTVFFLMVGLEIKREVIAGELSTLRQASLPIISAIGGMILPVIIYSLFCHPGSEMGRGMAIPMATDIAFSLGVLGLLGKRVPLSLKIFLTAFAVVDDIGGILIIAIFYSTHISIMHLVIAAILFVILYLVCKHITRSNLFIIIMAVIIWYMFMQSGIHSTISGVILAFLLPTTPQITSSKYLEKIKSYISHIAPSDKKQTILYDSQLHAVAEMSKLGDKLISPIQSIEHALYPYVSYIILPIFAFANAGIQISGDGNMLGSVSLGVACGLFFGKFLGIFSFTWVAIKTKIVEMPKGMNWKNISGVAILGGIGFTVSLFVAQLSFHVSNHEHADMLNQAKIGVIWGSVTSAIVGYLVLRQSLKKQ